MPIVTGHGGYFEEGESPTTIRRQDVYALAVLVVLLFAVYGFVSGFGIWPQGLAVLPECQEDSVLIGVGDFERGRWSDYECGPAVDDYLP